MPTWAVVEDLYKGVADELKFQQNFFEVVRLLCQVSEKTQQTSLPT